MPRQVDVIVGNLATRAWPQELSATDPPTVVPRPTWIEPESVDPLTRAFLAARPTPTAILAHAQAAVAGFLTLTAYGGYLNSQFCGSAGMTIPPPPAGAAGAFIVARLRCAGQINQTNSNLYATPGPKAWPFILQLWPVGDRSAPAYTPTANVSPGEGPTPHTHVDLSPSSGPGVVTSPPGAPASSALTWDSPGSGFEPGYHRLVLVSTGYSGYGESNSGHVDLVGSLDLTWYGPPPPVVANGDGPSGVSGGGVYSPPPSMSNTPLGFRVHATRARYVVLSDARALDYPPDPARRLLVAEGWDQPRADANLRAPLGDLQWSVPFGGGRRIDLGTVADRLLVVGTNDGAAYEATFTADASAINDREDHL